MADFCLYFGTFYFKLVLILKQFCKIMPFISFQAYSKQICLWKTVLSNIFVYNIQARTILNKTNKKHQELILRSCAVLNSLKDFHIISQFRDGCNVTLGMKTEHKHTWGLSWRVHSNCWSAFKKKKTPRIQIEMQNMPVETSSLCARVHAQESEYQCVRGLSSLQGNLQVGQRSVHFIHLLLTVVHVIVWRHDGQLVDVILKMKRVIQN